MAVREVCRGDVPVGRPDLQKGEIANCDQVGFFFVGTNGSGGHLYAPREFARLIGRSVKTLQRWDREGILKAYRSPTNRRYYTQSQYLQYRGLVSQEGGTADVARQENPLGDH